jgi:hypothetical protein
MVQILYVAYISQVRIDPNKHRGINSIEMLGGIETLTREALLKGRAQYSRPPYTN